MSLTSTSLTLQTTSDFSTGLTSNVLVTSVLAILLTLFLSYFRILSQRCDIISPAVPPVPQRHFFFGHLPLIFSRRDILYFLNANKDGISYFFALRTPCLGVLKASHCRMVLRNSVERQGVKVIMRHGFRTLGDESLILIGDSNRWKKQRAIVQKAFTEKSMKESTAGIWRIAQLLSRSLADSCEKCEKTFGEELTMDIISLMKAYALEVFGVTALGTTFNSITGNEDYSVCHLGSPRSIYSRESTCDDKTEDEALDIIYQNMSSEAKAFEFMINDFSHRSRPDALINPLLQFYWIPTEYNRKYTKMKTIVDNFLTRAIESEKERMGDSKSHDGKLFASQVNGNTSHIGPTSNRTGAPSMTHRERMTKNRDNLLTHLLQFNPNSSPSDLTKMLKTLLFAGFETTSISLSYALYCLATHPRCQERMAEEVSRVHSRLLESRNLDEKENENNHVNNDAESSCVIPCEEDLVYTRAVILESMRIHPSVVTTSRVLKKPMKLNRVGNDEASDEGLKGDEGHYHIAAGTRVHIPIDYVHKHEKNFERPLEFLPERWVRWEEKIEEGNYSEGRVSIGHWIERDPQKEEKESHLYQLQQGKPNSEGHRFNSFSATENEADTIPAAKLENFFAFSDGARNCVGRRLALISQTLLLASIIRALKVDVEEEFVLRKRNRLIVCVPESVVLIISRREE